MKGSQKIKILAAALALSLALPFAACEQTNKPDETEATVAETQSETETTAATDATNAPTASEKATETEAYTDTVTETTAPTESELASGTESETITATESITESDTEAETATEADSSEDTASASETELNTETETETTPVTETETIPATETETETETITATESETVANTEAETFVDPDTLLYGNGAAIDAAGDLLDDEAYALSDRTFDRESAIEKSAAEIKEMLADKTSMIEGAVYLVKEPIVLDSNDTKYYGNNAAIIAEGGIIIKDVNSVLIKELMIDGSITVENSTGVIIFRLCMTSSGIAINVDENSADVAIKSCRIKSDDTAIVIGADLSSIYQNYIIADKGIISTGDDMAMQSNIVAARSLGVSTSGAYCTVKNNSIEADTSGVAVELNGSYNSLVALNNLTGAQMSISIKNVFNCSVILNSAIRIEGTDNKNLYIIDNSLGGAIELSSNNYLICDGNSFPRDGKSHPVVSLDNVNFNGDNMHDVNARLEVGADEDLLPHTNKDLFISMERRSKVRDLSLPKSYAFNGYVRNMAKSNGVVIVPPGVYSTTSTLNIQSTHAYTTVYAYGVYQEATKYIKNIDISGAPGVTVKGLTIGYSLQSAGQIQVLDLLGDNQLLVISSAGFTKEFGQLDSTRFSGGGYFYHPGSFTSWTEIGNWGSYTVVPGEDGSLQNEDGTFVIRIGGKDAAKYYSLIEKGEVFTCRLNETNDRTISITSSKGVLFKDTVTYGYADALCFVLGGANTEVEFYRHHNLAHSGYEIDKDTYDKYVALEEKYDVDLEMRVDELGRYRGPDARIGSVDATHMASPSKGLTATSTLFENACDDAANQRGNSSSLHRVIDNGDGTLTIFYKDYVPETYVNSYIRQGRTDIHPGHQTSNFLSGDRIFIYASNGKIFCDTTTLSASTQYQTNVTVYEKDYKYNGQDLHLNWKSTIFAVKISKDAVDMSALDGYVLGQVSADMSNKIIVDNLSRNSVGFTFDNCMVRNNRGRLVIKTRDAVVTNCTFTNNSMAGIVMSVESTWGESSVPNNIKVTKCLFDGTSKTFNYESNTKYAALAVEGLGSGGVGKQVTVSEDTIPCKNITITDNVFKNVPNNYYVTVSAAQSVTINNNTFETRSTESSKRVGKSIYINGCMNVNISGNTYSSYAKGDMTKVIVVNNYMGLTGADVEGVFERDKLAETETE